MCLESDIISQWGDGRDSNAVCAHLSATKKASRTAEKGCRRHFSEPTEPKGEDVVSSGTQLQNYTAFQTNVREAACVVYFSLKQRTNEEVLPA